jgi:hypothetical protein
VEKTKSLAPAENYTLAVKPVAHRCNDWAIADAMREIPAFRFHVFTG